MEKHDKERKKLADILVDRLFVDNLTEAKALIMTGKVIVNNQRIDKPGTLIKENSCIRIKAKSKYVSRGGDKLAGAIEDLKLNHQLSGRIALDIGASTGGFSHCLLLHNIKHVIALDVGTNQLDWRIRNHPQVTSIEKTDIRKFNANLYPKIDLVVADISFNSLSRLASQIVGAVKNPKAEYLLLVKPQFELDKNEIPKGGIVRDHSLQAKAIEQVKAAFLLLEYECKGLVKSRIEGKHGNQEYFIYLQSKPAETANKKSPTID
ncbi:MAG: TlyA family RNA methyltransferase [Bdellovibrionota bacterium]